MTRSYGHFCAAARALDVLGDRWTLLVVRELLTGPQRYTDLLAGLPGISTDLLAARLRAMEADGLVERRVLPPPAASKVYALTEDGAAVEPVLLALARWGARRLDPERDDAFRRHWLELPLRSTFRPDSAPPDAVTVDFVVDDGRLRAVVGDGTISFDHHPAGSADVVVTGDPAALAGLPGRDDRANALAAGGVAVEGEPRAVAALRRAFGLDP
jgi:DNA-binding HxlR family transcriptional regulator